MLALIYVLAIWCVANALYAIVSNFEPDRRLSMVLRFLIHALRFGGVAISTRTSPGVVQ
jgi:hypothetical protein